MMRTPLKLLTLMGKKAAAFTPAAISGLQYWISADSDVYTDATKTTSAAADGDKVYIWGDKSGNNYDVSQATDGSRPILKLGANGINGRPAISFNGTAYLRGAIADFLSTNTTGTLIAVISMAAGMVGTESDAFFSTVDEANVAYSLYFGTGVSGGQRVCRIRQRNNDDSENQGDTIMSEGTPQIICIRSDGSSYLLSKGNKNEVVTASTGTNNGDWFGDTPSNRDNIVIGGIYTNTLLAAFNGLVAEIVIYDSCLTGTDLTNVLDYFNTRYTGYNQITGSVQPSSSVACRVPHQRSVFTAAGRIWVFYGSYEMAAAPFPLNFTSTADNGKTWKAATNLTTFPVYDAQWSVVFDGTNLHVAKNIQSGALVHDGMLYRRGVPAADGTITWAADWQTVVAAGNTCGDFSLAVGTDGAAWIAYGNNPSTDVTKGHCIVVRNSAADGTWSNAANFPIDVHTGQHNDAFGILSPLADGAMYCTVYEWATDHEAIGYTISINGTTATEGAITVSAVETSSGLGALVGRIESGGEGNGITHVVYQTSAQKIMYRKRAADGAWDISETELSDNTRVIDVISSPRLSFDGDGGVYVTWSGNNKAYMCKYTGGSWNAPVEIYVDTLEPTYEHIMPDDKVTAGKLPLVYLDSLFNVNFKLVDV